MSGSGPRVAVVHDYLTQRGGAERVVMAILDAFPGAPLFTSLYDPESTYPELGTADVRVGPLGRFGVLRRRHRLALPLLAPAFAATRVSADVVVCSSSGWAHGVRVDGHKLVYCHAVARWLYHTERYTSGGPSGVVQRAALRALGPPLRAWDRRAALSAARYVVNSTATRTDVAHVYGIDAEVLAPPVSAFTVEPSPVLGLDAGFFLCVSRLLPYKHVDAVATAFSQLPEHRLVVVGEGPERRRVRAAAGANVTMLDAVDDAQLRWLYESCRGLVAASYEDFGLTPVEAATHGRPTAALRAGGFVDTLVEDLTGCFFDEPTPGAVAAAVRTLAGREWDAEAIRTHAAGYAPERFAGRLHELVDGLA